MHKKILSLALALVMCMSLCIPAFATQISPQMRNADYYGTPPGGTHSYDYTTFISRSYGSMKTEKAIVKTTTALFIGDFCASLSGLDAMAAAFLGGSGSYLLAGPVYSALQTAAIQYNPSSDTVGYIMEKYAYSGTENPLEHHYKYIIYYYPYAVSSSSGVPSTAARAIFYEFNWFS